MFFHTTMDSPIGELMLVKTELGLCALSMGERPEMDLGAREPRQFEQEVDELTDYFAGRRLKFSFKLAASGTAFQKKVWKQLSAIPFGETRSYGEVARAAGSPRAVRAVGAANGRNPIGIVVPCHRVIAADGSLSGFAAGPWRKRWLLDWEHKVIEKHQGRRGISAAR